MEDRQFNKILEYIKKIAVSIFSFTGRFIIFVFEAVFGILRLMFMGFTEIDATSDTSDSKKRDDEFIMYKRWKEENDAARYDAKYYNDLWKK